MGASMSGATTVRGLTVDIDVSASDIFSNLQFGAMGLVVAREGALGLRVNTLQGELTFKGPGVTRSQDKTWADPIVWSHAPHTGESPRATQGLQRDRRVRCGVRLHMAGIPQPRPRAGQHGVVEV
jgi:hypothetical protein